MRFTSLLKKYDFPTFITKGEVKDFTKSLSGISKNRVLLTDEKEADRIISLIGGDVFKNKKIIELFPGPGAMTRKFLNLEASGIIPLEPSQVFIPLYKQFEAITKKPILYEHYYSRIDHSMSSLLFDISPNKRDKVKLSSFPWEKINEEILFFGLVSILKESYHLLYIISQLACNREGFFSYGRFPIYLITPPEVIQAYNSSSLLGFCMQSIGEVSLLAELNPTAFSKKRNLNLIKFDLSCAPRIKSPFNTLFYVAKKITSARSKKVSSCLSYIVPGAEIIAKMIDLDCEKKVKELSLQDIDKITLAYIDFYKNRHGKEPFHLNLNQINFSN